ncbi:MAG: RsmE family RNA methyltransferase [Flavobacteriia bacterium]
MHLFYAPELTHSCLEYTLTEEESKHCVRVLRLKQGSAVELLNGKGLSAIAEVDDDHPKKCRMRIVRTEFYPPVSQEIHLALAPTKNMDRMEWLVEKATEIGLSKLTFLKCDHNERGKLKLDRLEKIAISAMKQSKRYYLPEISELIPFKSFVENNPNGYIGHCYPATKVGLDSISETKVFLIGPEGDFSENEVSIALLNGYQAVSLSDFRLRTETAALISVMKLSLI